MEKKHTLTFAISQEELFVILGYLKQSAMLGLDTSELEKVSTEQKRMLMGVAERSLIARNMLVPDGNHGFKLSDPVLAMISGCLISDAILMIHYQFPNRPEEDFFFHHYRKLYILHTLPLTAIHEFIDFEDKKALMQSALSVLNLGHPKALSVPAGELADTFIRQAREAAADEKTKNSVPKLLEKSGIDPQTAEAFAQTMNNPTLSVTIARFIIGKKREKKEDGFAALSGENGLWVLKDISSDQGKEKRVSLSPSTPENVQKMLISFFDDMP